MDQEQPIKNLQESSQCGDAIRVDVHVKGDTNDGMAAYYTQKAAANQKESIGVQVVKHEGQSTGRMGSLSEQRSDITIGEALEATALTAGHRPVGSSDAAATQAAEVRATGRANIVPGGVAAAAQSAASRNARATRDEDKTKLREILSDASAKLPSDRPVMRRDAEGVIGAELRNDPNLCTHPGGVAASIAAAARLNQTNSPNDSNNDNN